MSFGLDFDGACGRSTESGNYLPLYPGVSNLLRGVYVSFNYRLGQYLGLRREQRGEEREVLITLIKVTNETLYLNVWTFNTTREFVEYPPLPHLNSCDLQEV